MPSEGCWAYEVKGRPPLWRESPVWTPVPKRLTSLSEVTCHGHWNPSRPQCTGEPAHHPRTRGTFRVDITSACHIIRASGLGSCLVGGGDRRNAIPSAFPQALVSHIPRQHLEPN